MILFWVKRGIYQYIFRVCPLGRYDEIPWDDAPRVSIGGEVAYEAGRCYAMGYLAKSGLSIKSLPVAT